MRRWGEEMGQGDGRWGEDEEMGRGDEEMGLGRWGKEMRRWGEEMGRGDGAR